MAVPGVGSNVDGSRPRRLGLHGRLPRRTLVALGAVLAMLLASCGGGEESDEPGASAGEGQEEPAGEGTEPPAESEAVSASVAIPAADEPASEGGVRGHRPVDDADAGCASIDEGDPGARILFPADGTLDAGAGPVTVEILGCGNTFEANVQWEAFHGENQTPTLEGFTEGGTMGEWGEFRFSDTYWTAGDWTVVVFEIDAESGDRREYDQVTFIVG